MSKASCASRILESLSMRNMKQSDLCALTGIPKSAMSQYCKGNFIPKQSRTALIAKALNVNEAWLMGYDVPSNRPDSYNDPSNSSLVQYAGPVAAHHVLCFSGFKSPHPHQRGNPVFMRVSSFS